MASAPPGWGAAAPVFSLLRRVLRLHRERLPPPMRAMGDTFVLSEFRRALRNKTSEEQWRTFAAEWQRYAAMLSGTADQQVGVGPAPQGAGQQGVASVTAAIASGSADMAEQLLQHLSPDQRRQLVKLQQEAYALGAEMLGKGGAAGADDGRDKA